MPGYGVHVGCFRPPSVPAGTSRLRLTARATLSDADLLRAGAVLDAVLGAVPRDQADGRPDGLRVPRRSPSKPERPCGRPMKILVIAGTGTEVGKTVVTAAVAALARDAGRRIAVVKPVQTGVPAASPATSP